jgi:hypothetical protein
LRADTGRAKPENVQTDELARGNPSPVEAALIIDKETAVGHRAKAQAASLA